jgi:hypothetical protein
MFWAEKLSGKGNEIVSWGCVPARDCGTQQLASFFFKRPPMRRRTGLEAHMQRIVNVSDQHAGHTVLPKISC